MIGNAEGIRKTERPNMRWIDSTKEATGLRLQDLSKDVNCRIVWRFLIHRVTVSRSNLTALNTHKDSSWLAGNWVYFTLQQLVLQ